VVGFVCGFSPRVPAIAVPARSSAPFVTPTHVHSQHIRLTDYVLFWRSLNLSVCDFILLFSFLVLVLV
jgi:hypothetical protein